MKTRGNPSMRRQLWIATAMLAVGGLLVPAAGAQDTQQIPLGSSMPEADASMSRVEGGNATLAALSGDQATVVLFWSNQCPWVERYEDRFADIAEAYSSRGVSFVLVNSNDAAAFPQEASSSGAARAREAGYPSSVTYLSDPSSMLARAFGAERTPHAFVFDVNGALVYVGTIDDSPGDPQNVGEQYLRSALESITSGSSLAVPQTKAFGCTIKFSE